MLSNVSMGEIFLILLVTLLLFGSKRIPEIARGLGQGLREFRAATRDIMGELDVNKAATTPPVRPKPAAGTSDRPAPVAPVTPHVAGATQPASLEATAPPRQPDHVEQPQARAAGDQCAG